MVAGYSFDNSREQRLVQIEKRIQSLHNEMEFVEILAQFWPWPNMAQKVDRLNAEIEHLRKQSGRLSFATAC